MLAKRATRSLEVNEIVSPIESPESEALLNSIIASMKNQIEHNSEDSLSDDSSDEEKASSDEEKEVERAYVDFREGFF